MPSLEEAFRFFWLRDIHQIYGVTKEDLREWITREHFIFSHVTGTDDFIIQVLDPGNAKKSIAHDSTRMASAAFETMMGIGTVARLPRSTAWILIRAYYAAFFAAHSLLRMLGTACVQLDSAQTDSLDHVADAFGLLPATGFEQGLYIANFDSNSANIHFQKSAAGRRGSHEILWETFANRIRDASNHLLTVSAAFNSVALQLSEIDNVLRSNGLNNGSWLSQVRNMANYRHLYGLWFPYADSEVDSQELTRIVRRWRETPSKLFPLNRPNIISLHVSLCTIIVSICYAVASDIETHALPRKCFHSYGGLALVRMMTT